MRFSRLAVLWVILAAFVSFGIAAGLPHVHSEGTPSHDCFACRAHSAQPVVEPTAAAAPAPPLLLGTIAPACPELPSRDLFTLPASRAPPLPA